MEHAPRTHMMTNLNEKKFRKQQIQLMLNLMYGMHKICQSHQGTLFT